MSFDHESLDHIKQRIIKTDEVIQILLNSKKECKKVSSKYKKLLIKYEAKVKELKKFEEDCQQVQNNLYTCLEKNAYWEKHCLNLESKINSCEKEVADQVKENEVLANNLKEKTDLVNSFKLQVSGLENELHRLKEKNSIQRVPIIEKCEQPMFLTALPNLIDDNDTELINGNQKEELGSRKLKNKISVQSKKKPLQYKWTDKNYKNILITIIKIRKKLNFFITNKKVSLSQKSKRQFIFNDEEYFKKITFELTNLNKTVKVLVKSSRVKSYKKCENVPPNVCEDDPISSISTEDILGIFDEMAYPELLSPMSEEIIDEKTCDKEFIDSSIQTIQKEYHTIACQTELNTNIEEIDGITQRKMLLVNPFYKNGQIDPNHRIDPFRIIREKWSKRCRATKNFSRTVDCECCGNNDCKKINFESINFNIKEKYHCTHNESYNFHSCQSKHALCNYCMHELYCCNSKIRCNNSKREEQNVCESEKVFENNLKTNKIEMLEHCDKNPTFFDDFSKKIIGTMKSMFVKEFYKNQSVLDFLENGKTDEEIRKIFNCKKKEIVTSNAAKMNITPVLEKEVIAPQNYERINREDSNTYFSQTDVLNKPKPSRQKLEVNWESSKNVDAVHLFGDLSSDDETESNSTSNPAKMKITPVLQKEVITPQNIETSNREDFSNHFSKTDVLNKPKSDRKKRKVNRENGKNLDKLRLFGDLSSDDEIESSPSLQKRKRISTKTQHSALLATLEQSKSPTKTNNIMIISPISSPAKRRKIIPIKSPEIRTTYKRPVRVITRQKKENDAGVKNNDNLLENILSSINNNETVPSNNCPLNTKLNNLVEVDVNKSLTTTEPSNLIETLNEKVPQTIDVEPLISTKSENIKTDNSSNVDVSKKVEKTTDLSVNHPVTRKSKSKISEAMNKFITTDLSEEIFMEVTENLAQFSLELILDVIIDNIIDDSDTNLCCEFTPPAPPLTKTQQKLISLIGFLHEKHAPQVDFQQLVLSNLESNIYASPALWKMANVARVFVTICKLRRDVERIRCFCVEALYKINKMAIPITFVALTCWPEILPINNEAQDNVLAEVFVYYLLTMNCPANGYNKLPLRNLLKGYYLYDYNELTINQLTDKIMKKFKENNTNQVLYAVLLLAKNQPTEFVFKNIIKPHLLPQLETYFKLQIKFNLNQNPNEAIQFSILENLVDRTLDLFIRLVYYINKLEHREIIACLKELITKHCDKSSACAEKIRSKIEIALNILQ